MSLRVESHSWPFLLFRAWMALRWEFFMELAMLGTLDGSMLGASHGSCYALEFGWPLVGSF